MKEIERGTSVRWVKGGQVEKLYELRALEHVAAVHLKCEEKSEMDAANRGEGCTCVPG
jgi:hypothetical protein